MTPASVGEEPDLTSSAAAANDTSVLEVASMITTFCKAPSGSMTVHSSLPSTEVWMVRVLLRNLWLMVVLYLMLLMGK